MKNRIDDAAQVLFWDCSAYDMGHARDTARVLDEAGHLMPDLTEPTGYDAGLPWWVACETEVRPAGYEQRVICTDENGPWEASAADAREFAYALLAAADYAERI